MNIFVLDRNPVIAAQSLDDVRLERLCFECLEMLSMYFHINKGISNIFKYREHQLEHPVSVWIRKDIKHYNWALAYGVSLCNEYLYRFGINNKYAKYYVEILKYTPVQLPIDENLKFRNSTINYKHVKDIVLAYKYHYAWKLKESDIKIPKYWTKRELPQWLIDLVKDLFTNSEKYIIHLAF